MRLTILPFLAGAALAAASASQASAAPNPTMVMRKVRYMDSELSTAEGAARIALRVRVAAAAVCDGDNPLVRRSASFEACREHAMQRAADELHAPLVTSAMGLGLTKFAQR